MGEFQKLELDPEYRNKGNGLCDCWKAPAPLWVRNCRRDWPGAMDQKY